VVNKHRRVRRAIALNITSEDEPSKEITSAFYRFNKIIDVSS
jgi:hypothetical protein